jgi:hypothetical protein
MPNIDKNILIHYGASTELTDLFANLINKNNIYIGDKHINEIETKFCGKLQLLSLISKLLNNIVSPRYIDPNKHREKLIRNIKINMKWLDMLSMNLTPELYSTSLTSPVTQTDIDGPNLIWPVFYLIFQNNNNSLKFCNEDGSKNFIIDPYLINSTLIYDKILLNNPDGISMNYNCRLESNTSKTFIIRIHKTYLDDSSYKNSLVYDEYLPIIHSYGKISFNYNFIQMTSDINFTISRDIYEYKYSYTIIDHYDKISSNLLDSKTNSQKLEFLINLIKLLELLYSYRKLLINSSYLGFKQNMPVLLVDVSNRTIYISGPAPTPATTFISIDSRVITWLHTLMIRLDLKGKVTTTGSNVGTRIYDLPPVLQFDGPTIDINNLHVSFRLDTVGGTQLNYTRMREILEWIRDRNILENP